jgi:hypothetical protein
VITFCYRSASLREHVGCLSGVFGELQGEPGAQRLTSEKPSSPCLLSPGFLTDEAPYRPFPVWQAFPDLPGETAEAIVDMDDDEVTKVQVPASSARSGRQDPGTVLLVVNGVIAGVGGSYAGTHSVAVTIMAGCAGLVTAALIVWKK